MKKYILSLLLTFFSSVVFSQEIPDLKGRVNFNGTYQPSQEQKNQLTNLLKTLDQDGKVELAVLVVDSVRPSTIEQYSLKVAEKWKIGKKGVNNGVVFVVATKDRKARIEVGRGLEGVLTDALTSRIQKEKMAPLFKKGDYYGGIVAVVNEIKIKTVNETPIIKAEIDKSQSKESNDWLVWILGLFATAVAFGMFFISRYNKEQDRKYAEEMEKTRKQWRDEYINNQRKYRPSPSGTLASSSAKPKASVKSRNDETSDVVTTAVIASSMLNSSSSDDDSRRSSSSSDSFSGGGGDYGGGGSSSDW
jgi:uncharacterized protein